jgi:homoserine O-acetyltransferase
MSASFSADTRFFNLAEGFVLESGGSLRGVRVAYRTWGHRRSGATLVCHALTGNANVDDWWAGLFGSGRTFDPDRDFIISSNVLGSCYGTTGPASIRPGTIRCYGGEFPEVSIRDMVRLQASLLDHLGVDRVNLVIGGSMGGMQALEWAILFPDSVGGVVSIGAGPDQSAWSLAFSDAQRAAITADPRFADGGYMPGEGPVDGLTTARIIAMISYRSPDNFETKFGRNESDGGFAVQSYLRYQGKKLVDRFDANSYLTLVGAMDGHDLGRGRGELGDVLAEVTTPVLAVGISSDVLYPVSEVEKLAQALPNAKYRTLQAPHGHDSFLIETDALDRMIASFRADMTSGWTPAQQQKAAVAPGAGWA